MNLLYTKTAENATLLIQNTGFRRSNVSLENA